MDSASLFRWDPRGALTPPPSRLQVEGVVAAGGLPQPPQAVYSVRTREVGLGWLEDLFQAYGIRYYTAAKIAELGFTMSTLLHMNDEELDDMMNRLSQIFRWDLLVGERYGIKAAVRAERRRFDEEDLRRRQQLLSGDTTTNPLDALSQEGLSDEPVQQEKEAVGSGSGAATWEIGGRKQRKKKKGRWGGSKMISIEDEEESDGGDQEDENGGGSERQREHPFIVTEPGEVARGKKNGLDYLFHLYEQCREFLIQAKERGEKCPTKRSVDLVHSDI